MRPIPRFVSLLVLTVVAAGGCVERLFPPQLINRGTWTGTIVETTVRDNDGNEFPAAALRLDYPETADYPVPDTFGEEWLRSHSPGEQAALVPLLVQDTLRMIIIPTSVKTGERVQVRGALMLARARHNPDPPFTTAVARDLPPDDVVYRDYLLLVRRITVIDD